MGRSIYYFNPKTLSFEKKAFSWKDIIKRVLWFLATALAFSVVIVWISFYLIDSPKELMLRQENEQLKEELSRLNKRYDQLATVAIDLQKRDDNIYRAIFESEPMPIAVRYISEAFFRIFIRSSSLMPVLPAMALDTVTIRF